MNIFTEHPNEGPVSQTYLEHGLFAWKYSALGFVAAMSGFIHGLFPFILPYHAANLFIKIYMGVEKSGRHDDDILEIRKETK